MNRKDVLTMCVVALGVAGIALAFFSPQPACAKGPAEGSRPKVTAATVNYEGCTVSIKMDDPKSLDGKITLECENPTSRMIDFPAILTWNTQGVDDRESRVARPAAKAIETRSIRCIAFPHSTASFDIDLPKANPNTLVLQKANPNASMLQLKIRMGDVVLNGPWIPAAASIVQLKQETLANVAANRR
jgi:hypothetical protein